MAEQGVREIDLLVHDAPAPTPRKIMLAPRLVPGQSAAARTDP